MTGVVPQGLALAGVAQEPLDGRGQAGRAPIRALGLVEAAIDAVADDVGDAAAVGAHHRAAGRHGLQQDQAKGFGARGEHKGIATGIGRGQFLAGQVAHKLGWGARKNFLQLLAVGPIPHQGQPGIGQGLEHGFDALDLLLSREPADVEEQLAGVAAAAEQPRAHGV